MTPLPITEAVVRQHSTPESFQRGQDYERRGAVLNVVRRGDVVQADVMGSAPEPYRVRVDFDAAGITAATCTCPVGWGWCKHVVATLLACLHRSDAIEERPPIATLVDALDRDQLHEIVVALGERDSALAGAIEAEIALRAPAVVDPSPPSRSAERPRPMPVDGKALRRQVRGALHSLDRMRPSEAYWQVGGVVDEVRGILDQAWAFIRAGDGRTALEMLEAITDEYAKEWTNLDDSDGMAGGLFSAIGDAWTEAVLSTDLSIDERETWVAALQGWEAEVADYGIDYAFGTAIDAAELGWDDPDLQQVLAGAPVEEGAWQGWAEPFYGGLTVARLNVLERQGRDEEYLRLARATGLTSHVASALVRLGHLDDAAVYGQTHFSTAAQALALAQRLREYQALPLAVAVAERGMALDGPRVQLAVWLRDLAGGLGKGELALEAAEVAFKEDRSLASYLSVEELAGDQWPERRLRLLDHLRKVRSFHRLGVVEIFLHEGLVDDAIAAVDGSSDYRAIEPVVQAAIATRPDWAIRAAKDQAEPILDQAQAQYYHHAVRWLAHARDAYLGAGRRAEWQTYVDGLLERHGRKHKLVPMLKALGR